MDTSKPNDSKESIPTQHPSSARSTKSVRDIQRSDSTPCCSNDIIHHPVQDPLPEELTSSTSRKSVCDIPSGDSPCCSKDIIRNSPLTEVPSSSKSSKSVCSKDIVHKPVAKVMPVVKKYEEIVGPGTDASVACTLAFIRRHLRRTDDVSSIKFSQCIAQDPPACSVVTLGADEETNNRVLEQSHTMSPSQTVPSVIRHIEMRTVSFVVPMIVKSVPLCRYFNVIQNQNEGLKTDKWCIAKQTVLEPDSAEYDSNVVYIEVENRVLLTYIDEESAELLKKIGKFKFMFWKLRVNFSPSL
ncbi:uncharacterized protein LOC119558397 [Drosophila subpulchrella]|uniref:uncharacterized protein LOC119558397 n=1 Tax=Drosophila subpulchrella TaxID=1486046 RepID=UPI0018A1711B|nr:uncharacterized protein LOC119558397 [Drosophila subpulchrella]